MGCEEMVPPQIIVNNHVTTNYVQIFYFVFLGVFLASVFLPDRYLMKETAFDKTFCGFANFFLPSLTFCNLFLRKYQLNLLKC